MKDIRLSNIKYKYSINDYNGDRKTVSDNLIKGIIEMHLINKDDYYIIKDLVNGDIYFIPDSEIKEYEIDYTYYIINSGFRINTIFEAKSKHYILECLNYMFNYYIQHYYKPKSKINTLLDELGYKNISESDNNALMFSYKNTYNENKPDIKIYDLKMILYSRIQQELSYKRQFT